MLPMLPDAQAVIHDTAAMLVIIYAAFFFF